MPRSKSANFARDSVFRFGGRPQPCQKVAELLTPTRRTGIGLTEDEIDWLDCRCCEIRRNGWRGITRSALIRALIESVRDRPLPLAGVAGEAELVDTLKQALGTEDRTASL